MTPCMKFDFFYYFEISITGTILNFGLFFENFDTSVSRIEFCVRSCQNFLENPARKSSSVPVRETQLYNLSNLPFILN
jgi:hypothetical protein